jgi:hypothetical protein
MRVPVPAESGSTQNDPRTVVCQLGLHASFFSHLADLLCGRSVIGHNLRAAVRDHPPRHGFFLAPGQLVPHRRVTDRMLASAASQRDEKTLSGTVSFPETEKQKHIAGPKTGDVFV